MSEHFVVFARARLLALRFFWSGVPGVVLDPHPFRDYSEADGRRRVSFSAGGLRKFQLSKLMGLAGGGVRVGVYGLPRLYFLFQIKLVSSRRGGSHFLLSVNIPSPKPNIN